jgi:hypothetical protein
MANEDRGRGAPTTQALRGFFALGELVRTSDFFDDDDCRVWQLQAEGLSHLTNRPQAIREMLHGRLELMQSLDEEYDLSTNFPDMMREFAKRDVAIQRFLEREERREQQKRRDIDFTRPVAPETAERMKDLLNHAMAVRAEHSGARQPPPPYATVAPPASARPFNAPSVATTFPTSGPASFAQSAPATFAAPTVGSSAAFAPSAAFARSTPPQPPVWPPSASQVPIWPPSPQAPAPARLQRHTRKRHAVNGSQGPTVVAHESL